MKHIVRKKRTVKGMTLVEVMVALCIFTVMTVMMVQIVKTSNALLTNATHTNNKVTIEAPIAELAIDGGEDAETVKVTVKVKGTAVKVKAEGYTAEYAIDEDNYFTTTSSDSHLKFLKFDHSVKGGGAIYTDDSDESTDGE